MIHITQLCMYETSDIKFQVKFIMFLTKTQEKISKVSIASSIGIYIGILYSIIGNSPNNSVDNYFILYSDIFRVRVVL